MCRNNYQAGEKIGHLTFLNRVESPKGRPMANFMCECGNEFVTRIETAKSGATKSCGCKTKELLRNRTKYKDGQKFGDITLLHRVESNPGTPKGLFLCFCGVEFETRISAVVSGHTKSCSCFYSETRPKPTFFEVGQKIGTCFYIADAATKYDSPRRATFKCHCGNYFITAIQSLINGTTKSCGCQTIELQRLAGALPVKLMPELSKEDIDRFWTMVNVSENERECWDWKGSGQRYGNFSHKGNGYKSNRIAYFIHNKIDPKDMEVMHKCDRTKCCNPNHLELGTHWDNMQDMKDKGRAFNGKEIKMYKDY